MTQAARVRRSRDPRASRRGVDVHARVRPARATPSAMAFDGNARGCAAADGARGDGRHVPRRGTSGEPPAASSRPLAPPPPALTALASAREPRRSLRASLHPRRLRVPDVENALRCRCELTPSERAAGCRRMRCRASNRYVADLFAIIGGDRERCEVDPVVGSRDDASRHGSLGLTCFTRTPSPTPRRKPSGSCFTPRSTPRSTRIRFRTNSGVARRTARARSTNENTREGTCCGSRGRGNRREPPTPRSPRRHVAGARDDPNPLHDTLPRSASCTRRSKGTSGTSPGTCCTCTSCGTGNRSTGCSRSPGDARTPRRGDWRASSRYDTPRGEM